eukprot:SAG31_NODE_3853_length_3816_cov_1.535647_4_plen_146_part_00
MAEQVPSTTFLQNGISRALTAARTTALTASCRAAALSDINTGEENAMKAESAREAKPRGQKVHSKRTAQRLAGVPGGVTSRKTPGLPVELWLVSQFGSGSFRQVARDQPLDNHHAMCAQSRNDLINQILRVASRAVDAEATTQTM